jgi:2-polyprenyl-6-methoxyphenol hydroxylase-like FAD-dependent oxidoreductase
MKRAIISGGGIAGLSAAIALSKTGWKVDVLERSPAIREIGAGIFIKGNGLRVLDAYGLLDDLKKDCVILRSARILDSEGTLLQHRPLEGAQSVWNILRQNLIRALAQRAEQLGAQIHTGMHVTGVSPDGTVTVNGTQERADLVVAADGVHSTARKSLGLDRQVRAPRSGAVRLLVPRTNFEKEDGTREFWSGRLRVGVAPCTETEVYSYLAAPLDDVRGAKAPLDEKYWAERFPFLKSQGFFARAGEAGGVHHAYPFVGTRSWVSGKVALVGDAAHALPPTLGQGAGLSLMNTFFLAEALAGHDDVAAGLASWESRWRWVSDRTQLWAKRYDWITSEWPPAFYHVRNAIIWATGRSRRFNRYMRVADRVDAQHGQVLA